MIGYNLIKEVRLSSEKIKEEVLNIYNKFYGNSPTRINKDEIEKDKSTATQNTITAIELILESIKHEDNRMYYEICFWGSCLEYAKSL